MFVLLRNPRVDGIYLKVLRCFPEAKECEKVANLVPNSVSEFRIPLSPSTLADSFEFWGRSKAPKAYLTEGIGIAPIELEARSGALVARATSDGWDISLQFQAGDYLLEGMVGQIIGTFARFGNPSPLGRGGKTNAGLSLDEL